MEWGNKKDKNVCKMGETKECTQRERSAGWDVYKKQGRQAERQRGRQAGREIYRKPNCESTRLRGSPCGIDTVKKKEL